MENKATIMQLLRRPIAYQPIVAKAFGSVNLAVMWSQLYYWSDKTEDPHGWVYKSGADMFEETGLTRRQQDTAREIGEKLGVLECEVRGTPPVMHYRVNLTRTVELLEAFNVKKTTRTLFAVAVDAKPDTPGAFGKRFFGGEANALMEISEWLVAQGVPVSDPIKRELAKFIAYWTEPTKSGKKVRWETEKTFEVKRRLATWLSNAGKWDKQKGRGGMRV